MPLFIPMSRAGVFRFRRRAGWAANNDPDIFNYVFSSKKLPPDGANRGHYHNAELDALLGSLHVETDREKRRRASWRTCRASSRTTSPYLNLWYLDNICVHRERCASTKLRHPAITVFSTDLEFRPRSAGSLPAFLNYAAATSKKTTKAGNSAVILQYVMPLVSSLGNAARIKNAGRLPALRGLNARRNYREIWITTTEPCGFDVRRWRLRG